MAEVKICGIKDEASLDAAISGGATYIGLVFFAKSPRHLQLDQAAALSQRARGRTRIVAVTVNGEPDLLSAVAAAVKPDFFQLHGSESPAQVTQIKATHQTRVIKAISIATGTDLQGVEAFAPIADMLLFDAKAPAGAALPGGNGTAFDWTILRGYRPPRPWLLSGGLDPENVARAITEAEAPGVDVSSGVERAPGVKDEGKILAFLVAAGAKPHIRQKSQS